MIKVEVKGLRELQAVLTNTPKRLSNQVSGVLEQGAKDWVRNAKRDVPKNYGKLAQTISYTKDSAHKFSIVVMSDYAAYVEFGTKGKYQAIPGAEDEAAKHKGKGSGTFYDFVVAIYEWVKKKGIARITNSYTGRSRTKKDDLLLVAERIAWSILKNGINPHPFFFKQKGVVLPKMEAGIRQAIDDTKL